MSSLPSFLRASCLVLCRRARGLLRGAFYLTGALVAALSLAPGGSLPPTSLGDKMEHVLAYAALGLLGAADSKDGILRTILGLAAFGLALELLQVFSPGRSPDPVDLAADVAGAAFGCGLAALLRHTTSLPVDNGAGGTTPCRAGANGGDPFPACDVPAATSASSHKRASCVSD